MSQKKLTKDKQSQLLQTRLPGALDNISRSAGTKCPICSKKGYLTCKCGKGSGDDNDSGYDNDSTDTMSYEKVIQKIKAFKPVHEELFELSKAEDATHSVLPQLKMSGQKKIKLEVDATGKIIDSPIRALNNLTVTQFKDLLTQFSKAMAKKYDMAIEDLGIKMNIQESPDGKKTIELQMPQQLLNEFEAFANDYKHKLFKSEELEKNRSRTHIVAPSLDMPETHAQEEVAGGYSMGYAMGGSSGE